MVLHSKQLARNWGRKHRAGFSAFSAPRLFGAGAGFAAVLLGVQRLQLKPSPFRGLSPFFHGLPRDWTKKGASRHLFALRGTLAQPNPTARSCLRLCCVQFAYAPFRFCGLALTALTGPDKLNPPAAKTSSPHLCHAERGTAPPGSSGS